MELCQYVDLCFHTSSLPCSHTFWHAIPTSFYIVNVFKSCVVWINLYKPKTNFSHSLCSQLGHSLHYSYTVYTQTLAFSYSLFYLQNRIDNYKETTKGTLCVQRFAECRSKWLEIFLVPIAPSMGSQRDA